MKLQISFDISDLDKAIQIASTVAERADILEVGTILIYKYGIQAIEKFKESFPQKTILADSKIVDRGKLSAPLFAQAGADWITVMAGSGPNVIHATCTTAHNNNIKVMLDLMDSSSPGQSAMEAKSLGVDALLFHQPYDAEKSLVFLDKWDMVKGNTSLPIFISAKINQENVHAVIRVKPDGIIVGKSITDAENPAQEAQFFADITSRY